MENVFYFNQGALFPHWFALRNCSYFSGRFPVLHDCRHSCSHRCGEIIRDLSESGQQEMRT